LLLKRRIMTNYFCSSLWRVSLMIRTRFIRKYWLVLLFLQWRMSLLVFFTVHASFMPITDASVLAFQSSVNAHAACSNNTGRNSCPRPHSTYCNKLGHTRDCCFKLHGQPKSTTNVVQSEPSVP
jgi:hypothetical protein